MVVIDGSSGPRTLINGLEVAAMAGGCTIRGLVISNFTGWVLVLRSNGNTVEGNYIGTNAIGTLQRSGSCRRTQRHLGERL